MAETNTQNNQKNSYLLTRTHISWVIAVICLGFLAGVLSSRLIELNISWTYLTIAGSLFAAVACFSRLRLIMPVALIAGALLGWARVQPELAQLKLYDNYIGTSSTIRGVVVDDPSRIKANTSIQLSNIVVVKDGKETKLPGRIWLSLKGNRTDKIKRSDQVEVMGDLEDGFGVFVASMKLAQLKRITHIAGADPMGDLRDSFGAKLKTVMNDDETNLGMGILAGQKSGLSQDMKTAFMAASLTHILVASGYNLTVLTRFARRLLAKYSRLVAFILSVTLVLLFAGVTGMSASMMRAALVAIFSLMTWYYGRNTHPVILLSFIAALTILIDPSGLWGDAGWYMSFGSFAGVVILAPLLRDLLPDNSIVQILTETISAQLVTLPIIAYFMGNVSIIGLMTNLLVLPILPLAMLLTFVAGVVAWLLPLTVAAVMAYPARWLLDYVNGVANWGADIPFAMIEFKPELGLVIGFYAVLLAIILILKKLTGHNFYTDNVIE